MAVDTHAIDSLRPREREVLRLIAEGKTNPEIARELGITFETAKWHVSEVLQTLHVSSREEAGRKWRRYRRLPARLRRSLSAVPVAWKWIGASGAAAALAIVAGVFVLAYPGDDDADSALEPGVYIAYIQAYEGSSPILNPDPPGVPPLPIEILEVTGGERSWVGGSRQYLAVYWSPTGNHLAALAYVDSDVADLLLIDIATGDTVMEERLAQGMFSGAGGVSASGGPGSAFAPQLSWSADGSIFGVTGVEATSFYSSDGESLGSPRSLCPDGVAGAVAWPPRGNHYIQPCAEGFAYATGPRANHHYFSYSSVPSEPFPEWAHGGLRAHWLDESTAVLVIPHGDQPTPAYAFSVADSSNAVLGDAGSLSDEQLNTAMGYPPSGLLGSALDTLPDADRDVPGAFGGGLPGATAGAWVFGRQKSLNQDGEAAREEYLVAYDGSDSHLVRLVVSWGGGIGAPASGWGAHGPVAHLLVVD